MSPRKPSAGIRRVALYARVSTLNGRQDPEMQLSELREYAARRGLSIHEEYVDQGVSGSKESRPALNRLMNRASRADQTFSCADWQMGAHQVPFA
jgi:DNA invertase Pin-like site-specific DNA recombinase